MISITIKNALKTQCRIAGLPARLGSSVTVSAGGVASYNLMEDEWRSFRESTSKSTLIRVLRADSPQASVPATNKVTVTFSEPASTQQAAKSVAPDEVAALREEVAALRDEVKALLSAAAEAPAPSQAQAFDPSGLQSDLTSIASRLDTLQSDLIALTELVSAPAAPSQT